MSFSMKKAIFVEPHNCPERIVLDTISEDSAAVVVQAKIAIAEQGKLAYIWRRNAHQMRETQQRAKDRVFSPIIPCIQSGEQKKRSFYRTELQFRSGLNFSSLKSKLDTVEFSMQLRIENFLSKKQRGGKGYVLYLPEFAIARDSVPAGHLINSPAFYYSLVEEALPHVDGANLCDVEEVRDSSGQISLRLLLVHQGAGTLFWEETVADIGGLEAILNERNYIDTACLEGRQTFQTKTGDVLIFQNAKQTLSDCFIHQGRGSLSPTPIKRPDMNTLRLIEICNLTLHL